MRKPVKGSRTPNIPDKIIRPNGDIYKLYSVSKDRDGGVVTEYKSFKFPKSAGQKALEKKQQTKMKKATSPMKKKAK